MKLCVKEKQIWNVIGTIFLILVLVVSKNILLMIDFERQMKWIAVFGIIVVFYILLTSYFSLHRVDGYMIFISISFFFFFGQQTLLLFESYPDNMILFQGKVSDAGYFEAGYIILFSLLCMHLGYTFTLGKRVQEFAASEFIRESVSREKLMLVGKLIFLIVLIPSLYVLCVNVYLTFIVGYGERMLDSQYRHSGLSNMPSILAQFMVPAILAMFISKNKEQKWPVILLVGYIILYLLSGSRTSAFVLICAVFYAYITVHKRINKKLVIKYFLMAVCIVIIFGFISNVRSNIQNDQNKVVYISETLHDFRMNNPISKSISEAGYTFSSTAVVVDNCPEHIQYLKGKSYLSGLIYLLPNGFTNNYYARVKGVDETFQSYLTRWGGIGSSFIAEAYYNFGKFSYVLEFLYGIFWGILCCKIENNVLSGNYLKTFLYLGMFAIVIFYVRSDTRTFFRNFVWFYYSIYFIAQHLTPKRYEVNDVHS